jgi:hypothetical protein
MSLNTKVRIAVFAVAISAVAPSVFAHNDRVWMGDCYIPVATATDSMQATEKNVASSDAPARIWLGDAYIPNTAATDNSQVVKKFVASSDTPAPALIWLGDVYIPNPATTDSGQVLRVASTR